MSQTVDDRLREMGVELPEPARPVASYVGFVRQGNLVVVSGQLPMVDGMVTKTGLLGRVVPVHQGSSASGVRAVAVRSSVRRGL